MLSFKLLGQVLITHDEKYLQHLYSNKALALLCYLVVEDGIHRREVLADLIWGGATEERAKANLRNAVYQLAKILPHYLISERHTVTFKTELPYSVDVVDFERLLNSTEPQAWHQAMMLYDGVFLKGLYVDDAPRFEEWLRNKRYFLEQSFITCMYQLAEYQLNQREYQQAATTYQTILEQDMLQECAHEALMLAWAKQGNLLQALAHYQHMVDILQEELGIEPRPDAVQLQKRLIHAQQHKNTTLIREPNKLIGREESLNQLSTWLSADHSRLITLTGLGGTGKSRLALHIAHGYKDDFINGAYYISLASVDDVEVAIFMIAQALGIKLAGKRPIQEQIIAYLKRYEMLIVLDNLEHLPDLVPVIASILEQTTDIKILVTSREVLNLREEYVCRLQGLSTAQEEKSLQTESNRYFLECCAKWSYTVEQDKRQLKTIHEICQLLEGLPLGIELAVGLMSNHNPEIILAELHQTQAILQTEIANIPNRHRSLFATFEYSWRLLSDDLKAILKKLSVFRGSFSTKAAAYVSGASADDLRKLEQKSLLQTIQLPDDETVMFVFHELIREFTLDKLGSDYEPIRRLHMEYYCQFLAKLPQGTEKLKPYIPTLSAEYSNIRLSVLSAIEWHEIHYLEKMVSTLAIFLRRYSLYEGMKLFNYISENLISHLQETDVKRMWGSLQSDRIIFLLRYGNVSDAIICAREAVQFNREQADPNMLVQSLHDLGLAHLQLGEFNEAHIVFTASIEKARSLDNKQQLLTVLTDAAIVNFCLGDYTSAIQVLEEALPLQRGDSMRVARLHINLGAAYHALEQFEQAKHNYYQAIHYADIANHVDGKGIILINLGLLYLQTKEYNNSIEYCQSGIQLLRELSDRRNLSHGLAYLSMTYSELQKSELATQTAMEAASIALEIKVVPSMLRSLLALGISFEITEQSNEALFLLTVVSEHNGSEQWDRSVAQEHLQRLTSREPVDFVQITDNTIQNILVELGIQEYIDLVHS